MLLGILLLFIALVIAGYTIEKKSAEELVGRKLTFSEFNTLFNIKQETGSYPAEFPGDVAIKEARKNKPDEQTVRKTKSKKFQSDLPCVSAFEPNPASNDAKRKRRKKGRVSAGCDPTRLREITDLYVSLTQQKGKLIQDLKMQLNMARRREDSLSWSSARSAYSTVGYINHRIKDPVLKQAVIDEQKNFAARDPLYSEIMFSIHRLLKESKRIKQAKVYKELSDISKDDLKYVLYFAEQLGDIHRTKLGSSYEIYQ